MTRPRIEFKDFRLDKHEVDEAMAQAKEGTAITSPGASPNLNESSSSIPDHVLSVKSLSDAKRNVLFNAPSINGEFPKEMRVFNSPQPHDASRGEFRYTGFIVIEKGSFAGGNKEFQSNDWATESNG